MGDGPESAPFGEGEVSDDPGAWEQDDSYEPDNDDD